MCSLGIEPTTFALLTQCSTTEPQFTDKLRGIAFIIADESNSIMNAKLPNLSVNYGSVYQLPLNLKTGDGGLAPITELALLMRCA